MNDKACIWYAKCQWHLSYNDRTGTHWALSSTSAELLLQWCFRLGVDYILF